jgi:hypothetical protein
VFAFRMKIFKLSKKWLKALDIIILMNYSVNISSRFEAINSVYANRHSV